LPAGCPVRIFPPRPACRRRSATGTPLPQKPRQLIEVGTFPVVVVRVGAVQCRPAVIPGLLFL